MTSTYASGKHALAICDRCGWECAYKDLKRQIYDRRWNGLLVCADCLDQDHPQLQVGRTPIDDPQALLNPRPDTGRTASTSYYGWDPVRGMDVEARVGNVSVTTS